MWLLLPIHIHTGCVSCRGLPQRNYSIPESAFEGGDEGGDAVHPEDVAGGEGGVGGGGEEGLLALDGDEEG